MDDLFSKDQALHDLLFMVSMVWLHRSILHFPSLYVHVFCTMRLLAQPVGKGTVELNTFVEASPSVYGLSNIYYIVQCMIDCIVYYDTL